ncbi:hypothetical protein AAFF_G00214130 [Aldrovandia affinis]|uniref:Uncharacterized protein n=1 Tax=Aldrovandia affinis TaxID=143900 RepID=A0AAD7RGE9_9TELE|nr:hypothetical protein AAFF_G00214130 [Aldrovandia affinis]
MRFLKNIFPYPPTRASYLQFNRPEFPHVPAHARAPVGFPLPRFTLVCCRQTPPSTESTSFPKRRNWSGGPTLSDSARARTPNGLDRLPENRTSSSKPQHRDEGRRTRDGVRGVLTSRAFLVSVRPSRGLEIKPAMLSPVTERDATIPCDNVPETRRDETRAVKSGGRERTSRVLTGGFSLPAVGRGGVWGTHTSRKRGKKEIKTVNSPSVTMFTVLPDMAVSVLGGKEAETPLL